jgi:hypothetical protein
LLAVLLTICPPLNVTLPSLTYSPPPFQVAVLL